MKKKSAKTMSVPMSTYDDKSYMKREDKRNYGFNKRKPAHIPMSDWAWQEMFDNQNFAETNYYGPRMSEIEKTMCGGVCSGFGQQKSGKLRVSGMKGAHQIGKRK